MTDDGDGVDPETERWLSRRALLAGGLVGVASSVTPSVVEQQSRPERAGRESTPPPSSPPPRETMTENPPADAPTPARPNDEREPDQEQTEQYRTTFAAPGEVQETINLAATNSNTRVRLYPEQSYDPSESWQIKSGVTLAYNGATLRPTADLDLHHVHPGGCVLDPVVDLRNVTGEFSSSVFRFDSEQYGFYGENQIWHVRGGFTRGRPGEGTLYEFVQGNSNSIYFVHADHAVWQIGTVVDMHRGDAWGINGNRISGLWYGFDTGIHMHNRETPDRSVDNISGNHFDVIAQPSDSEILWNQEVGRFNVLRGRLWDFSAYSDVLWRIHDGNANRRYGNLFHWFPVGGTMDRLTEDVGPQVFDDRLGDRRNRVIVPWTQGRPIADFTG